MSKGTIFYIGGFELPDKNAAALRVLANGAILRTIGYDVVFIGVDTSLPVGGQPQRSVYSGFECWAVPYPKGTVAWINYILGLPAILKLIKQPREARSVGAICYNYPALASLQIRRVCRQLGMKMLADATEWYDSSGGSLIYRTIKFCDTTLRMHVVHGLVDGVITTSKYLTQFYNKRGKLTVELPTLFDGDKFQPPVLRAPSDVTKFIYVGSPFDASKVNRHRNNLKERLDTCIELFYSIHQKGKRFQFDVYGISLADYLKVFPEHELKLGEMKESVFFHGRKPNSLVLDCIAKSDFSIFFRDRTRVTLAGFPSKLAESISVGTPVISNNMLSLEPFAHSPGVILTERGSEVVVVETLLDWSSVEIDAMKQCAFKARTFHYGNYASVVSEFLKKLGL